MKNVAKNPLLKILFLFLITLMGFLSSVHAQSNLTIRFTNPQVNMVNRTISVTIEARNNTLNTIDVGNWFLGFDHSNKHLISNTLPTANVLVNFNSPPSVVNFGCILNQCAHRLLIESTNTPSISLPSGVWMPIAKLEYGISTGVSKKRCTNFILYPDNVASVAPSKVYQFHGSNELQTPLTITVQNLNNVCVRNRPYNTATPIDN